MCQDGAPKSKDLAGFFCVKLACQDCIRDPIVLHSQNVVPIHLVNFVIFYLLSCQCELCPKSNKKCHIALRYGTLFICDPGRIRTCDLLIRSQLLYPAELRNRLGCECACECVVNADIRQLADRQLRVQKYLYFLKCPTPFLIIDEPSYI